MTPALVPLVSTLVAGSLACVACSTATHDRLTAPARVSAPATQPSAGLDARENVEGDWGPVKNGLRCRIVAADKAASGSVLSAWVEVQNASDEPLWWEGSRTSLAIRIGAAEPAVFHCPRYSVVSEGRELRSDQSYRLEIGPGKTITLRPELLAQHETLPEPGRYRVECSVGPPMLNNDLTWMEDHTLRCPAITVESLAIAR